MDANGLRFWLLADSRDWQIAGEPPSLHYDINRRSLRLASQRLLPPLNPNEAPEDRAEAEARLAYSRRARDAYGAWAYWDRARNLVMAAGAGPEPTPLFRPPLPGTPTDLAMGYDGVLYLALAGQVLLYDLRGRWRAQTLAASDFVAERLAPDPAGGVWVLDSANRRLAHVRGLPFPERPYVERAVDRFRPAEENPDPPRFAVFDGLGWPSGERPVAIASAPGGRLAMLNWLAEGDAVVRLLARNQFDQITGWQPPIQLLGARSPYSLAWVSEERVAVLLPNVKEEAPVYEVVANATAAQPVGDFYPLYEHNGEPFVASVDLPPHYPTEVGSRPLHHLSLPAFAPVGEALNAHPIDSGNPSTVWHRLYLEAMIPANGGIVVELAASDQVEPPTEANEWYAHQFGERFASAHRDRLPRGAWVNEPSEIPYHPGLSLCQREAERAGLFTVLIQRTGRRVRALRGRFLHVRVQLVGDKRTTPELWAVRAYASRFSYVERYLPALYHETLFGEDADAVLGAGESTTAADFLERFVNTFESVLTPLEGRIANSYLLTDPRTTPNEALTWLGSWIGVSFEGAHTPARQRALIAHAPKLFQQRGTLAGLRLALNLATDGAVDGGEIVIVEDWRLRRTFATILGANLAATDDPLLAGLSVSGNSFVGDTLFLGDAAVLGDTSRQEFLALFQADGLQEATERQVVQEFFDRLAHRVTVLVHQALSPQDLGLIRRIVELETPAHVAARVVVATSQFLVGMAALVGVDSYLAADPGPQPVRVQESQLGVRDLLLRPASLDPRLYGYPAATPMGAPRPVARLPEELRVPIETSFRLEATQSFAAAGRTIVAYLWTRVS